MAMNLQEAIKKLEAIALDPKKSVAEASAKTGKPVVGCFPIYTPEEIVYAAGCLPVGMWGGKTEFKESEAYYQGFCCSIIKTNVELGMTGAYGPVKAVLIPALCDTLKCTIENWKCACKDIPAIGVLYPQNRWTSGASDFLVREYKKVRSELEKITGVLIAEPKIEKAWNLYEEYRALMREFVALCEDYSKTISTRSRHLIIKAAYFMDKADYIEDIKVIIAGLKELPKEKAEFKIVTTGLIGEPLELLDIFDENGISIAADDVAQESRQFRVVGRDYGTIWERMAGRILDQRGCTFLAEQKKSKGQMLIDMYNKTGAKCVVVVMMKFCDPEEFDYPVIKAQLEAANIPLLYLEIDMQMDSFEQIRTRVQGFCEML